MSRVQTHNLSVDWLVIKVVTTSATESHKQKFEIEVDIISNHTLSKGQGIQTSPHQIVLQNFDIELSLNIISNCTQSQEVRRFKHPPQDCALEETEIFRILLLW